MGSQVKDNDDLTVLVTGFGPFRQDYPVNPSWEIAKSLPPYLPPRRAKDPNSRAALPIPEVRIVTPPEAIEVSYRVVRDTVPKLWDEPLSGSSTLMPDIVLHIGMAGALPAYFLERRGHRTGYKHKDVNGEFLDDQKEGKMGEDWIWYGLPDEIESDMDVPDVMQRWKGHSPDDMDLRISDDAGHFLCDFIYYSSLAHLYKAHRPRKVLFLHVPATATDEFVTRGRDLVVNLIRSIVESETERKNLPDGPKGWGAQAVPRQEGAPGADGQE